MRSTTEGSEVTRIAHVLNLQIHPVSPSHFLCSQSSKYPPSIYMPKVLPLFCEHNSAPSGPCIGFSGGCVSVRIAPDLRSPDNIYSSGIKPHFIFISGLCILSIYPFVLWRNQGQPEIIFFILSRRLDLANEYAYRFDFNTVNQDGSI